MGFLTGDMARRVPTPAKLSAPVRIAQHQVAHVMRLVRLGLVLALSPAVLSIAPQSAIAAISFRQVNAAIPQTPQTTVAVTYTAAQTAGNLNVVVVGWSDSTAIVNSLADSKGNVYTRAVGPTVLSGTASQSIYYAKNIVAAAANTNTVTVQFSMAAAYPDIRILEYSGLETTNPVDVTAAATGTNASSNSGAVTTTNANDLIFGANLVQTRTSGPGTGFTSRIITQQDGDIAEDRVVTTTGSYSATAPLTSAGAWIMQMIAFKAAASGPDLTLAKSHTGNFTVGTNGSYTVTVQNVGSAATTGPITVTDPLPTGLSFVSGTGTGWTCSAAGQTATCTNPGPLAAGANSPVTLTVGVAAAAVPSVTNTATVAGGGETNTANDTASDVTTIGSVVSGLVAAYSFNEGIGPTVADASGNGNGGSISGATWTTQGKFGSALVFNGNALVTVNDSPSLDLTSGMTLEAWVYPTATPTTWSTALMKEQPGNLVYTLYAGSPTNRPNLYIFLSAQLGIAGTAALPLNTWSHLAGTYDGTMLRLYVNGTQVASRAISGNILSSSGPLRIGGNGVWPEYFTGRIDEIRVYNRALSATQIQSDMNTPIGVVPPDTTPPTAPGGLTAVAASSSQMNLAWTASTDNVGVTGYRVERCQGAGCSNFTEIATPTGTTYPDTGLTAGTSYSYRVRATDPVGNLSPYSNTASATTQASDTQPPTVSITAPNPGPPVSQVITISATASDNVGVVAVEFLVDGISLGTDSTAPYIIPWNTTTANNGAHTLIAVARDAAGNQTTSAPVVVTTLNPAFVNEVVVPDISAATTIAFLPGGRMLVGELTETIWVVQPGASQPDPVPFLQLDNSQLFGEQGLMDIILDPNFAQNAYYYIFYTRGAPGQNNHNRVSRFTASGNGTVPGSEVVLWQDDVAAEQEHHAGTVAFGPDGKIYITYGDQFQADTAQQLDSYRGKILRINPDGSIPNDNPFYDGNGPNKDEIWAMGLRNPFRMSFDRETGRMYIGDVGGNDPSTAIEEVNLGVRGANYGWPFCEGNCPVTGTTNPIYSYPHSGRDASITGGFVYRGSQFPSEYYGSYFFADYVQNTIKRLTFDANGNVTAVLNFWPPDGSPDGPLVGDPVKLIEGPDGSLYYVDIGFNDQHVPNPAAVRRIRYVVSNQPPVVVASANPTAGLPPLMVAFSSAGSSDPEGLALTYSWTFGDGSSSTAANPTHTYQAAGAYIARLTVSDGVNTAFSSDVSITVGRPPTATILTPVDGRPFRAGDSINYSGLATDPDDGDLPASAFSWTILFHHESHVHPGGGPFTDTKTGTLVIPTSGHDFQGATSYEIILSVTDSTGLTASTSVTVFPEKVHLAFDTAPSGLTIESDGISKQTPFALDDLMGFQHTINAPGQFSGSTFYRFVAWSDGGTQSHGIVVPTVNQNYVATFETAFPPGLVAAYSFNEGAGTTVIDASGNSNTGSISGATWTTQGKFGNALMFNGSDRVTVNDSNSLDLISGMTLEAWVYPTATPTTWSTAIMKEQSGDLAYTLYAGSPANRPNVYVFTNGQQGVAGPAALPLNTWSHLAATYDGTTLRLYVNGTQVASRALSGSIVPSTGPLRIGGNGVWVEYFRGRIDEVRIYNRALGATEIQFDMNTPIP